MKYLITGAGGQLGREWMHQLDRRLHPHTGYTSSQLDITQKADITARIDADRPDVVINCAAYTHVDRAEEEPEKADAVNHEGVRLLAESCRERDIKLVHYSTDYIFPGYATDRKLFPRGYPEEQPADPVNQYGLSKWKGEEVIRQSGTDALILRVAWLCGAFGQNFVTKMMELAKTRSELRVVNDQWGSPTFTPHVVENTRSLLRQKAAGTYHINCRGTLTWYELAVQVFNITGKKIAIHPVSSKEFDARAGRPSFSKLDTRKLENMEGSTILHWRNGLKQLLRQLHAIKQT